MEEYKARKISNEKILEKFFSHYSEASITQYKSAINRFLDHYKIDQLSNINYLQWENYPDKNIYLLWFIKYLFSLDYLVSDYNFPNKWVKESIIEHFERRSIKNSLGNSIKDSELSKPKIDVSYINLIEETINTENVLLENTQLAFSWYVLFYTDCPVDELKKIDFNTFDGEYITTQKGRKLLIPPKFYDFIEYRRSANNKNRMTTLDIYVKEIGEMVGIENLLPKDIAKARKLNTISCPNCSSKFASTEEYWYLYLGRLVCVECAEILKKKDNLTNLSTVTLETDYININSIETSHSDDFETYNKYLTEIGKLGEEIVYNYERNKLKGTEFFDLVDKSKSAIQSIV